MPRTSVIPCIASRRDAQVSALFLDIPQKAGVGNPREHLQRACTGNRVAAEGRAVRPGTHHPGKAFPAQAGPMGSPPPSPFAVVITSGMILNFWKA